MADLTTLQTRLSEAEDALHKLLTGQKAVSVSDEGQSVTFTQSNIEELRAYINELRNQIADLSGVSRRRGPIYASF
jgi:polyhydroxyalkanoate synthesis regulator phasin